MRTQKRITPPGYSYWKGEGVYQKEYEELYDKLVPLEGSAKTLNGELIRAVSQLTHEYYNNGNANIREYKNVYEKEINKCEIEYIYINPFYKKFINLIESVGINTDGIKSVILNYCEPEELFVYVNERKYIDLMDEVMHYVLTHKDKNLPDWYEIDK